MEPLLVRGSIIYQTAKVRNLLLLHCLHGMANLYRLYLSIHLKSLSPFQKFKRHSPTSFHDLTFISSCFSNNLSIGSPCLFHPFLTLMQSHFSKQLGSQMSLVILQWLLKSHPYQVHGLYLRLMAF